MGQGGGADQLVAPPAVDVALLGTRRVVETDGTSHRPTWPHGRRGRALTSEYRRRPAVAGSGAPPKLEGTGSAIEEVVEQIALRSHRVFAGASTAPVIPHEQHSPVAYVPLRPSTAAAAPGTSDHAMRGD